jgi:hypothetical protein
MVLPLDLAPGGRGAGLGEPHRGEQCLREVLET